MDQPVSGARARIRRQKGRGTTEFECSPTRLPRIDDRTRHDRLAPYGRNVRSLFGWPSEPGPALFLKSRGKDRASAGRGKLRRASGPLIPTFASRCGRYLCECWNQRTTSKLLMLVELWI